MESGGNDEPKAELTSFATTSVKGNDQTPRLREPVKWGYRLSP
jgi:hypothetical protein